VREAVTNNVFGTANVAKMAGKYGAKVFVMVSTDKAVNPTSVMGTSKRIAELVVQATQQEYPKTRYVSVRFGNVLGSSGSVIPLFREQIRKGGPITVTHPDIKRYFMTIPEASRLVLQAAMMGRGGEIFVLDMGEPIKIVDLAERMIRLSGLKPNVDIAIQYTGLRPGEKMFEELSVGGEHAEKTRHPKIFIGRIQQPDAVWLKQGVARLKAAVEDGESVDIRRAMADLVPESALEGLDRDKT
jgi:FlaA1/EpsC-like NDP-sugar epimerase